jgi:predicted GNAT family acetyltransferase
VLSERIYRVDASTLSVPKGVTGAMRAATVADREQLIAWWILFVDEALSDRPEERAGAERAVDARLHSKTSGIALFVVDDKPVSLAGFAGPTPHGIRIGPVYTPKALRGHGYASALTASLSKQLLDEGRKFCFLFTDLSNPTSNKIYTNIGYREVADVDQISFAGA